MSSYPTPEDGGGAVPGPRTDHLARAVNLDDRGLHPLIPHLHAEQGVVGHLDGQNGPLLLVEEVPHLHHPVHPGGEEHR